MYTVLVLNQKILSGYQNITRRNSNFENGVSIRILLWNVWNAHIPYIPHIPPTFLSLKLQSTNTFTLYSVICSDIQIKIFNLGPIVVIKTTFVGVCMTEHL